MAIYLSDDGKNAFQEILTKAIVDAPTKGKNVIVQYSRKHSGKQGIVFWHGKDKFSKVKSDNFLQQALHDIVGKYGFRVGVLTADGERFFIPAENVVVITE